MKGYLFEDFISKHFLIIIEILMAHIHAIGLILFAFSTTGCIVFLVLSDSPDCDNQRAAVTMNDVLEILILLVMIVVSFYVSLNGYSKNEVVNQLLIRFLSVFCFDNMSMVFL